MLLLEESRRITEERGLNISRKKTSYLGCNEHQHSFTVRDSKESEDIQIWDRSWRMVVDRISRSFAERVHSGRKN